jgi:hypothetical protein
MLVSWPESERIAVVVDDELRLYSGGDARLSLQAINTHVPSVLCMEWHPSRDRPADERLVALGQSTGNKERGKETCMVFFQHLAQDAWC